MGAKDPVWVLSAQEVASQLDVDIHRGLSAVQVQERRAKYGFNQLDAKEPTPLWKRVAEQFEDTLVQVCKQQVWPSCN